MRARQPTNPQTRYVRVIQAPPETVLQYSRRSLPETTHTSDRSSLLTSWSRAFRGDRFLTCIISLMLTGGSRTLCMIYSSSASFLGWTCIMQTLHNISSQQIRSYLSDLSDEILYQVSFTQEQRPHCRQKRFQLTRSTMVHIITNTANYGVITATWGPGMM